MVFENIIIELYIDNSWINITDDVVSSNGIQLTPRIDGTFMVGTFDAWLTREYIPAYTPMRINYNSNITLVCSSTSNKYLFEENKYYHTFDIFEGTAILSNFIVGSKAFSVTGTNKSDIAKINILIELMQNKYGLTITNNIVGLNNEREFSFGAGTTFYDALSMILADYDLIPIVTQITNSTTFTINMLNKNDDYEIQYSNDELTSVVNKQNMDNYCKYLESEASNVVDRTTETTWKDLTVRAEDILINADEAAILLPSKVEKITSIKTNGNYYVHVDLDEYNNRPSLRDDYTNYGIVNKPFDSIFYYLADKYTPDDPDYDFEYEKEQTSLYKILKELFEIMDNIQYNYSSLCSRLDSLSWSIDLINNIYIVSTSAVSSSEYRKEVIGRLKEKADWDTLDVTEKPKYMYYESGTNVIKGLYEFYKDDLWGKITGGTVTPWYNYVEQEQTNSNVYNGSSGYVKLGISQFYNPMNAIFDIKAICETNPIIKNEKSINPLNEQSWKPYARSYNNNATKIEFDKLEERMQISNDSLGDVELEIEMTNPSSLPLLINTIAYKLTYNNVPYYVMAFVINIRLDIVTIRYSLSRTYSKKAEVIGVDSQFEATPNPLKKIITRPIYIDAINGLNVNLDEHNYLQFIFKDKNNQIVNNQILYKRFSLLQNRNTKLLYCEMIDQYTFDYNMIPAYGTNYYKNPVPYVNNYNEAYSVTISLVKLITNDAITMSKTLPKLATGVTINEISLASDVVLYKDAREHLTFTIKLN